MEETVRKVSAIFDKMASVKITPTSNYSVPEYWMNRAIKGDEKCKDNLFNWISLSLNIDKSILNAVFNAKYNKTNENKVMNMNIINEIGDTPKGQEMLGRTAERAYQRAQRTSGADKQRHEKTEWDAYQTAAGNSRKHLDGSGAHFARGRDAEYDEHWDDGRYPWSKKHKSKNESKTMNKKLIRLTESDLHKIVKESAKRIMKEVALKGKSGKTYSLHGTDPESWAVMSRVRGKNGYFPNTPQHYHACRDEDNWIELDDKAHPNLRSRNNANRINAMMNRIDDKSKDIMAANESKLSRIVKESVNRILREDLEGDELRDYVDSLHLNDNVPNERGIFHEYDPNLYGAGHGGEWYYRYGRDGRKYDVQDKWIPRVDDNGNEIYDPYEGGDFYILYSPEVGFLENDTYESYEAAQEALMEYGNAYEDLTIYFVPEGDLSNAEEA